LVNATTVEEAFKRAGLGVEVIIRTDGSAEISATDLYLGTVDRAAARKLRACVAPEDQLGSDEDWQASGISHEERTIVIEPQADWLHPPQGPPMSRY
jgi:hypothetical protein